MSTQLDPAQPVIEFSRRDKIDLLLAQYLKRLKRLELELTDLLALPFTKLKKEIYSAWRMGVHWLRYAYRNETSTRVRDCFLP